MEYTQFKPLSDEPKRGEGFFSRLFRSSNTSAPLVAPSATAAAGRVSSASALPAASMAPRAREPVLSSVASALVQQGMVASPARPWMPDELVNRCHSCDLNFTTLRRRHHCRTCGQIFCNACANNFLTVDGHEVIRVCNQCLQSRNQQQQQQQQHQQHQRSPRRDHSEPDAARSREELRRGNNKSPVTPAGKSPASARSQKKSPEDDASDSGSDSQRRLNLLSESEDEQNLPQSFWDQDVVPSYPIDRRVSVVATPSLPSNLNVTAELIRTSALREQSVKHVRSVISNLLSRDALLAPVKDVWLSLLCSLAIKSTRTVSLRRDKDSMSVIKYVRVKAISGGAPEESHFVRGVVLNKTVAHKQMRARLEKPRVLLMGCAVEFSRPDWKFVTFEVLQVQERDFLRILVDRIASLKPDILITSESVSSIALEFLMELGITCVSRVAQSALERLSRFTGASIVPNLSDIPTAVVGQYCEVMRSESLVTLCGKRSFLIFDVCPPKRGGTIVLRGADLQMLHALKAVLLFAISTAYHLRLEDAFLDELSLHSLESASHEEDSCVVSMSPDVVFAEPVSQKASLPVALFRERPIPDLFSVNAGPALWQLCLNFDYGPVLDAMEKRMPEEVFPDTSNILNNQSITYCFSRHHSEKRSHCVTYQYHHIPFYSPMDLPLGTFLLWSCDSSPCSLNSCSRPMHEHECSFLYGSRRMFVSTLAAAPLAGPSTVLSWFVCNECQESSAPRTMSHDALHLSVGKMMELLFLNRTLSCSVGHRVNPSGTLVFSTGARVVNISFLRTPVFGVEVPPLEQRFNAQGESAAVERELASLAAAAHITYEVIKRRVDGAMMDVLAKEEGDFLQSVNDAKHCRLLQVNRLYRLLLTNVMRWQGIFEESAQTSSAALVAETPRTARLAQPGGGGGSEVATPAMRKLMTTSATALAPPVVAVPEADLLVAGATVPASAALVSQKSDASLLGRLIKKTGFGNVVVLQAEIADIIASTISKESTMFQLFSGRGAPMPLSPLTNEVVMVLDQEPSSHIACALGTDSYREQIHDILGPMVAASSEGAGLTLDLETMSRDLLVKLALAMGTGQYPQAIKVAFESMLPRLQYTCDVTIYYPVQFAALRRLFCGGEAAFVHSMARSQRWAAKEEGGGASKAQFVNTMDGLYLLKSVPTVELRNFQAFAQKYFDYLLGAAAAQETTTMLVKIVGMFSIEVKNSQGSLDKQDFIVMEKLFHNRTIARTFDLKGSVRNRLRPENSAVLQDENLRRMMWSSPLVVDDVSKAVFARAIWNDTAFLSDVSVMDYSILVGVDEQNGEMLVGIIDYIRPYSWDKQFEYLMKATPGIISGTGKRPTVISPTEYKDRFRQSTWNYFTMAPNRNTIVVAVDGRARHRKKREDGEDEVPLVMVSFDE